jgi:hypothetical protein
MSQRPARQTTLLRISLGTLIALLASACGGSLFPSRELNDFEALQPWLGAHSPVPTTTMVRLPYALVLEHPGLMLDARQLAEAWRGVLLAGDVECSAELNCTWGDAEFTVQTHVDGHHSGTTSFNIPPG